MKTKYASVITDLPGPESRRLLERKELATPRGAYHNLPVFIESGNNALLTDVDGNTFIDFAAGIGVLNVGHTHPDVVNAAEAQLRKFTHTCFHVTMYEPFVALAEQLNVLVPGNFEKKTYFANSGAEAIENAVKIARYATGRQAIVAFEHGFHGRTLLGMSLTGKAIPYKRGFGPLAPEVYHLPLPYCYRCRVPRLHDGCCMADAEILSEQLSAQIAPDEVAAILFEPVLGEGGIIPVPHEFLRALRKFSDENRILLIADEIQTGWGRTGKLFAMEHSGIAADITVTAKSLGAGLPISAVTGRAEIMDAVEKGGIGGTYAGNPVACAAALAAVNYIVENNLPLRAQKIGERMQDVFTDLQGKFECIGDVRGLGAMNGLEFVNDRVNIRPAPEKVLALQKACFERGLIVLKSGAKGHVLRTLPPLTIDDEVLEEGLEIFSASLAAVEG